MMSATLFPSQRVHSHSTGPGCVTSRALFRPSHLSNAHGVPSSVCQHHKQSRQHRGRPGAAKAIGRTQPASASSACEELTGTLKDNAADKLVAALKRDIDTVRCHRLSAPSCLALSQLTALCNSSSRQDVLAVLAQHGDSASEEGVFRLLVQLLFGSPEASSPGLAADFVEALLTNSDGTVWHIKYMAMSPELMSLASQLSTTSPGQILQLISTTAHVKVKTAALVLLALKAALGDDSVTAIHEAGASFVLYDEIYQVACTSYSKSISVNGKLVQQELAASEAFISSAQHVIDQLVLWSGDFRGNSDKLITLTTCHATSSCQLLAAPRSQTAIQAFISPFQNLLAVFSVVVPWLNAIVSTALAQRSDDRPGLYIGKRILAVQQAVQHQTQVDSAAPLVSLAVDVYQKALQSNDKQFASSRVMPFLPYLTQMEKLTLARRMQPLLLRMLQHPQERLRHTAARALSATYMQTRHPEVLVSLLSCKEDVLGLLLKLLAGEDEEDSRCKYAILLGLLSTRTDAAGCKRIADAGAVPYVLQLLKQTDMESVKIDCVRCLVSLTLLQELRPIVEMHGGTSQLLDIAKAGVTQEQSGDVHVSTQDVWLTEHAVKILGQLLIVPEAAQTAFRLGLSALLNRLAQCSEFAVSAPTKLAAYGPGGLLSCIYSLHRRPGGDEQLVRELQLQSISNILTQTLDWVDCGYFTELSVESNNFNEGMLASAEILQLLTKSSAGRQAMLQMPFMMRVQQMVNGGSDSCKAAVLPTYGSILRLRDQWPSTPPSLLDSDRVAHERGLLQGAVSLLDSSNTRSRHLSSVFLANLTMEDDSLQTCKVLHGMGAAEKGLNLLKSQAEDAQTHLALLHMLVNLQTHEQLPHKTLLRAGLQHCLVGLLNAPDSPKQYIELAGTLVCSLWKECPSLVTEFVDDGHLPSLLERVANFRGLREGTVLIMLVLIVLKYTDALATEPLLLKAITKLVTACQDLVASPVHPVFEPDRKNALDLQVSSVTLLSYMAQSSFYRPAIRKAAPASAVADMLTAGCLEFWLCTSLLKPVQVPKVQLDIQSDSEQERHVAQAATQLVHKLLQSQLDGSDGLDAAHNTEFLRDLSSRYSFANSLLHMCKQGSLKSQHAALSVLQQFLVPEIWHQACATMRRRLISLGAVPTLLQIAASKVATADIQTLAESSLQGFHCDSDSTRLIGAFGMHSLVASMIFQSVTECRGTNQDYRSR